MADFFSLESQAGRPIDAGRVTLIPFSRSLKILLPHRMGGFILNLPSSVLVRSADGDEQVLPIIFVSRVIEWTIWLTGIGMGLWFWKMGNKRSKQQHEE